MAENTHTLPATVEFEGTEMSVIDRHGRPWMAAGDIGAALGFSQARRGSQSASPSGRVSDIYRRHADEFTADMTAVVDLPTAGGVQKVRIFSPRGCHLLAMFARTPKAKAFRKWVLDVLDKVIAPLAPLAPAAPSPPRRALPPPASGTRVLRFPEVKRRVGYSRMHVHRLEKAGQFPKRIKLGENSVGWFESEVEAWILTRAGRPPPVAGDALPALPRPKATAPPALPPPSSSPLAGDMLEGIDEIAAFMGLAPRQVYHQQKRLPLFRIGAIICARKSTLLKWIADQEAAALSKVTKEG